MQFNLDKSQFTDFCHMYFNKKLNLRFWNRQLIKANFCYFYFAARLIFYLLTYQDFLSLTYLVSLLSNHALLAAQPLDLRSLQTFDPVLFELYFLMMQLLFQLAQSFPWYHYMHSSAHCLLNIIWLKLV